MNSYIITYDLRNPTRDYPRLYDRLSGWDALRVLESVFVISNDNTSSSELRNDLKQYVDKDDGLFVAKLTGEAAWTRVKGDNQDLKNKLL